MLEVAIPVISIFVGLPFIIFSFIYRTKKLKYQVDELRLQKEILELEVRKKELAVYEMHAANQQLEQQLESELKQLPRS